MRLFPAREIAPGLWSAQAVVDNSLLTATGPTAAAATEGALALARVESECAICAMCSEPLVDDDRTVCAHCENEWGPFAPLTQETR